MESESLKSLWEGRWPSILSEWVSKLFATKQNAFIQENFSLQEWKKDKFETKMQNGFPLWIQTTSVSAPNHHANGMCAQQTLLV